MLGMAGTQIALGFALFGWAFGRRSVTAAPLVLLFAAVPYTLDEYASTPVWWFGFAVACLWAILQIGGSFRQLNAVAALANSAQTGKTLEIGPNTGKSIQRILRRRTKRALTITGLAAVAWAAALSVLPFEMGRTYQEMDQDLFSPWITAGAAIASILAAASWIRRCWTSFARARVGRHLVWDIPFSGGPIRTWPMAEPYGSGLLREDESLSPGCICKTEAHRSEFEMDEDEVDEDEMDFFHIPPSPYCPLHGVDRINSLTPEEFRALARRGWLWDGGSAMPESLAWDPGRAMIADFAGHGFTGVALMPEDGYFDAPTPASELELEASPHDPVPSWRSPQRPSTGELDRIDLRPAGFQGFAIRYRHGPAWYDPITPAAGS